MSTFSNIGSRLVDGDLHFYSKVTGEDLYVVGANTHPLDFSDIVIPANTNVLRGTGIIPTRASGWTAFSGTVTTTPAQVYTDYRELHSAGVAEVLGLGQFVFMDSGASCKSLFAGQFIAEVDAGAVVLSAEDAPAIGVFALWAKTLLNGETFTAGGVAAVAFLSFQANVTDVAAEDTSFLNMEVASGGIRSVFKLRHSGGVAATNFFELDSEVAPVVAWAAAGGATPETDPPDKALRIKVGATSYLIGLYTE